MLQRAALTGRLFDAAGNPMSPTHARGRSGKLYRYYVSAALQRGQGADRSATQLQRVSAVVIERALADTANLDPESERSVLESVEALSATRVVIAHRDAVIEGAHRLIEIGQ